MLECEGWRRRGRGSVVRGSVVGKALCREPLASITPTTVSMLPHVVTHANQT